MNKRIILLLTLVLSLVLTGCNGGDTGDNNGGTTNIVEGTLVTNDEELVAAIADTNEDLIIIAPGTYTTADMVEGLDRTANPLTIRGRYSNNKPVFNNATQSLIATQFVTFKDLRFVNTGALVLGDSWFSDGDGTNNIVLDGLEFYSPPPPSLTDTTPSASYGNGMTRLFSFAHYQTYNYTIQNIVAEYALSVGDFRMNGDVLLNNIEVDKWYFDGIRILGHGEEGYVEGNRIISNVDLTDNIAVYNEMGNSAPHPDNTQMFNSGSTSNNTNPCVTNLLFYHNRFNPGQLRGNNTQSGLSQSYMDNTAYVENLWATKSSPHGISIEGGGNGVLIERNTMADINFGSSPWVRIFRSNGQISVFDNYFPGGYNIWTNENANVTGYELDQSGNDTSTDYTSFFNGPAQQVGIPGLISMLTPQLSGSVGALTTSGVWRNLPHRPMKAAAPVVTPGVGQFTLTDVRDPTLWSPDQASLGADNCLSYNTRWSPAGSYSWTVVSDIVDGAVVSSVSAGGVDVQTQCVNAAGVGLWSRISTVTVN